MYRSLCGIPPVIQPHQTLDCVCADRREGVSVDRCRTKQNNLHQDLTLRSHTSPPSQQTPENWREIRYGQDSGWNITYAWEREMIQPMREVSAALIKQHQPP